MWHVEEKKTPMPHHNRFVPGFLRSYEVTYAIWAFWVWDGFVSSYTTCFERRQSPIDFGPAPLPPRPLPAGVNRH